MSDGHEVVVIREVLEGMLRADLAGTVLFDALERAGEEPQDRAGWVSFVEGPLGESVEARTSPDERELVVSRICQILGTIRPSQPDERPARRSQAPTHRFPTMSGPTRILLFAASHRLGRRLKSALGAQVAPVVFQEFQRLQVLAHDFEPQLLLIDLTDPPASGLDAIVEASVRTLDDEVIAMIWDEGSRIGQALSEAFESAGRRVSWVDRREGVNPLLDLIRACRG